MHRPSRQTTATVPVRAGICFIALLLVPGFSAAESPKTENPPTSNPDQPDQTSFQKIQKTYTEFGTLSENAKKGPKGRSIAGMGIIWSHFRADVDVESNFPNSISQAGLQFSYAFSGNQSTFSDRELGWNTYSKSYYIDEFGTSSKSILGVGYYKAAATIQHWQIHFGFDLEHEWLRNGVIRGFRTTISPKARFLYFAGTDILRLEVLAPRISTTESQSNSSVEYDNTKVIGAYIRDIRTSNGNAWLKIQAEHTNYRHKKESNKILAAIGFSFR